ncbi:MAG: hypothetical protein IJ806_01415 [Ruminococcus sp.]|nr:hypothetical protein [Ruminococcus sp.]
MDENVGIKAKIFCVLLILSMSAVCFLAAWYKFGQYNDLIENCTSEVTGVVTDICHGSIYYQYGERYLKKTSRTAAQRLYMTIEVNTDPASDGSFKQKTLYETADETKVGQEVTIHYSPDDPDLYYLNEKVCDDRITGIVVAVIGVFVFIGAVLLTVFFVRNSHWKAAEKKAGPI